jgi:hypothetical protein
MSADGALAQAAGSPDAADSAASPPTANAAPASAPEAWRYSGPMEMRYVDGRPIPPGYHLETRPRKGLVVSGPIIFGIPYVLSASVAASSRYDPDRWLYLPVVGPFVDLGARGSQCTKSTTPVVNGISTTTETCVEDSSQRFFLMLDGLMQTAGATMLILGLALPNHLLVRDDAPYTGSNPTTFGWTVRPWAAGRTGYGVGVDGFF